MAETVIRDAKLFEATSYPERGISFTTADLDAIIVGFEEEISQGRVVPIRVQHGRSPWEGKFGKVIKVWRAGTDLMGKIEWPKAVWDFLCTMGTKSLSVGFDWRQRRLREVSVVDRPRVLTAQAFNDSMPASDGLLCFSLDFEATNTGGVKSMAGEYTPEVQAAINAAYDRGKTEGAATERTKVDAEYAPIVKENADLKRGNASEAAAVKIAGWKAEGKLPPAAEKFAAAILVDGTTTVTFADGGHMTAAEAFVQFMTNIPQIVNIPGSGKTEQATRPEENPEQTKYEKYVYSQLGVTDEEVDAVAKGLPLPQSQKGEGE